MLRLFVGMIIGSMMAILAADGPVTAERILTNAYTTVTQPTVLDNPSSALLWVTLVCCGVGVPMWWKRRQARPTLSQYHFLLR